MDLSKTATQQSPRKSKEEIIEWVVTLTEGFLVNGWAGNFQSNFSRGGLSNVNVTICLSPGQTIEIKG